MIDRQLNVATTNCPQDPTLRSEILCNVCRKILLFNTDPFQSASLPTGVAMSDSAKCPRCGGELPASFPPGICPTCLLQQGLSPSTFISGADSAGGNGGSGRRRSWTPPTPAELAPRFPQWEIVELLGQGGMGAVYKVRQRDLDRWAALKVLPDEVAHDPNFAERFQREARALALLGHQHIVIVYEFGQRDGVYFLLMEYIDGVTLRQAIRAGQISAKDALAIVSQICDALQFAHEEGVVHRDIKPENILIDKRGRVKIADFGLAKLLGRATDVPTLTGTNQVMGTPMYMAPEQLEGTRGVDHRADIFSLGVVFYELLTGELPLGRFAPPSQKYQLDVRLDEVVLRTLEKEPDRRYQQASDVKCDVESIRNQPNAAAPSEAHQRMRSFSLWRQPRVPVPAQAVRPRKPWTPVKAVIAMLAISLGAFAVLLIGAVGTYWLSFISGRQQIAQNQAQAQALHVARDRYNDAIRRPHTMDEVQRLEQAIQDPIEANAIVQFTAEGPKLRSDFGTNVLTTEQRRIVNQILAKVHNEYLATELRHTTWDTKSDGTQVAVIRKFEDEISKLENDLWIAIDSQLPVHEQKFLRSNLPLFADDQQPVPQPSDQMSGSMGGGSASIPAMAGASMGMMSSMMMGGQGVSYPTNLRYPQLLGWKQNQFPIRISANRRGKWYGWSIELSDSSRNNDTVFYQYRVNDSSQAPEPPTGLRRFWRENAEVPQTKTLDEELRGIDGLRAAGQTPWDEVERRSNHLLKRFTTPADKGRIHWQAAHVYGQSDIRGHSADVTRHAKEGLKYERDPVQRGWLFMYLGGAAEVRENDPKNFVTRRTDAAQWYLKGYAELLSFNLPNEAPELPNVGKIGDGFRGGDDGEIDPEQIAAEVRQTAQMRTRKEAEFVRALVERRNTYVGSLRELFVRLHEVYDKDSMAKERLRDIATEVIRNPKEVERLLESVWPNQEGPPANHAN